MIKCMTDDQNMSKHAMGSWLHMADGWAITGCAKNSWSNTRHATDSWGMTDTTRGLVTAKK